METDPLGPGCALHGRRGRGWSHHPRDSPGHWQRPWASSQFRGKPGTGEGRASGWGKGQGLADGAQQVAPALPGPSSHPTMACPHYPQPISGHLSGAPSSQILAEGPDWPRNRCSSTDLAFWAETQGRRHRFKATRATGAHSDTRRPDAPTPSNYEPSNYPKLALTPVWPPHLCHSGFSTPTPPKTGLEDLPAQQLGSPCSSVVPRKSSSFPPQLAGGAHRLVEESERPLPIPSPHKL